MAEPTIEEFRDEVTAFLDANAERKPEARADQTFVWGEGGDDVAVLEEKPRDVELAELAEAKVWKAKRYDAGFGWITGPKQYGGRELPVAYDRAYASPGGQLPHPQPELLRHRPRHGRPDDPGPRHRQGEGPLPGQDVPRRPRRAPSCSASPAPGPIWPACRPRPVKDGDEWIVNGQKVWTSGAHYSDIGEVICRTDPDQPKHRA